MATAIVFAENRSPDEKTSMTISEEDVSTVVSVDELMNGEAYRNVVLYSIDYAARRLHFAEVSSLEELAAEPFLDRGIRKLTTGKGFALPFDAALSFAKEAPLLASAKFVFVWNTGRCGSTLMHRALWAAGACSLSEPWWFDQFTAPWGNDGFQWPDASDIFFMCYVLDCHKQLAIKPSRTFVMNPKGFGFRAFHAVDKAFPASSFDVAHVQMYRSATDVVESFGSIFFQDGDHPPRTLDVPTAGDAAVTEKIGVVDASQIPRDNFSKDMGFRWAEQYWHWGNVEAREDFRGKTRVVSFREFCKPTDDAARAKLVAEILAFTGLAPDGLDQALDTFKVNSQAGDRMAGSSAATNKKFLDEDARESVRVWVAHLTSGLGPDAEWPGTRFV
jgi:hypothetical protein